MEIVSVLDKFLEVGIGPIKKLGHNYCIFLTNNMTRVV